MKFAFTEASMEEASRRLSLIDNPKVLEFGMGNSTVWLAGKTTNLISVDHSITWVDNLEKRINSQVSLVFHRLPYHSIADYFPDESFDAVIVDGRNRVKCIEATKRIVKRGGFILLDDAQRRGRPQDLNLLNQVADYREAYAILSDWDLITTQENDKMTNIWVRQ